MIHQKLFIKQVETPVRDKKEFSVILLLPITQVVELLVMTNKRANEWTTESAETCFFLEKRAKKEHISLKWLGRVSRLNEI
jgi:hypothetical protein